MNIYDAYWEGYDAYKDDKSVEDNPYCATLEEKCWQAWKDGYYDAAWDAGALM